MKCKNYLLIILLMNMFFSYLHASELSDLMGRIGNLTICNFPFLANLPGIDSNCQNNSWKGGDTATLYAGRMFINGYGCGTQSFNPNDNQSTDTTKHIYVSLIGDSLTHYAGDFWNFYLSNGTFKVKNMGAAGATSSAWREHFEHCTNLTSSVSNQRLQLPPRTIMMIGGNDFHVFKSILMPLWWAVPLRRNSVLNNIEKIATHHHRGNNGCGDYDSNRNIVTPTSCTESEKEDPTKCFEYPGNSCKDKNGDGTIDYKDWGRGRLYMLLGNIPAASLDPTVVPYLTGLFQRLGYYMRPHDDMVHSQERINAAKEDLRNLGYLFTLYRDSWITFLSTNFILSTYINYQNCGILNPSKVCDDHSWVSRQMFTLQFWEHALSYERGGIPFIHMYTHFRDGASNTRGCWWCADKSLWYNGHPGVIYSFDDGIHINHVAGYARWASRILPEMERLQMNSPKRTDDVSSPGAEQNHGTDCDDLCMLFLCYWAGICN
jgi:hypothetical protein